MTRDDKQRLAQRSTEDSEAYRLYLRGRHAFFRRTPDSLQQALRYLEQAIDRDPDYALAHSGICDAYAVLNFIGGSRWRDVWLKCREAAAQVQVALEAEPLSPTANHRGAMVALQRHRPDEAIALAGTAMELDPNFLFPHMWVGMAYEMQERYDDAIAEIETVVHMLGESALEWRGVLAHALAGAGRRSDATALLADLRQRSERRYIDPFWLGGRMRASTSLRPRWTAWNAPLTTSRST